MVHEERKQGKDSDNGKGLKETVEGLRKEVNTLREKVRERFRGTGEEMRGTVEELSREVRYLSDRVRALVPRRRSGERIPVRRGQSVDLRTGRMERPLEELELSRGDSWMMPLGWPWSKEGFLEWPRVELSEGRKDILVEVELPGVDPDDLDLEVTGTVLTLRGEKREVREDEDRDYHYLERMYGSFERRIGLPCKVEPDNTEATFRRGILKIRFPKAEGAREVILRIPVRSG